jgi:hypothetical protein
MTMKVALSSRSWTSGSAPPGSTNCGRNARKKMVSFGFRMLSRKALRATPVAVPLEVLASMAKAEVSRQVAKAT